MVFAPTIIKSFFRLVEIPHRNRPLWYMGPEGLSSWGHEREKMDNAKKFIVPVIFVILAGGLAFLIYYMTTQDHRFEIPGKTAVQTEIEKLGLKTSELDAQTFKFLGLEPYTHMTAVVDPKDYTKNQDMDINVLFAEYNSEKDAADAIYDYYSNAQYMKNKHNSAGVIKLYYNKKKNKAYAIYDISMDSEWLVENFIMLQNSRNLLSDKPKVTYLYGGVYLDGKRVINVSTTERSKKSQVQNMLNNLGLPKP